MMMMVMMMAQRDDHGIERRELVAAMSLDTEKGWPAHQHPHHALKRVSQEGLVNPFGCIHKT